MNRKPLFHVEVTTLSNEPIVLGRTCIVADDRRAACRAAIASVTARPEARDILLAALPTSVRFAHVAFTATVIDEVAPGAIEPAWRDAVTA